MHRYSPSIERWVARTKKFSGFIQAAEMPNEYNANELKLILQEKGDHVRKEWEFRIAVYPTKDNLNKAVQALAKVFSKDEFGNIPFKCFVLNDNNENNIITAGWDATQSINSGDRDQRGKEICIYMPFDPEKKSFQRTPSQWKELMLQCWAALLEEKVEGIGYCITPFGDKAVEIIPRLSSPFSYTAFKPYKQRHGILFKSNYNENKMTDPLEGVVIDHNDLNRYKIPSEHTFYMAAQRAEYMRCHYAQSMKLIRQELKTVWKEEKNYESLENSLNDLEQLIKKNSTSEEFVATLEKKISTISKKIPYDEKTTLQSTLINELLHKKRELLKNRISALEFSSIISKLREFDKHERIPRIESIIKDFHEEPGILSILSEFKIDQTQLLNIVNAYPVKAQVLYRKLIHLQREECSLSQLTMKLYPTPAELKEVVLPAGIENAGKYLIKMILTANKYNEKLNKYLFLPDEYQSVTILFKRFVQHRNLLSLKHENSPNKSFLSFWHAQDLINPLVENYDQIIKKMIEQYPEYNTLDHSTSELLQLPRGKLEFCR